jgi:predicted RNA-binding Zn-ribbon protein involved in translation (DUF1610 family)
MFERARGTGGAEQRTGQTTVVTTCPECGEVRVDVHAVSVLVDEGTPDAVRLAFSCPMCRRNTATRIHRAAFGALRIAGASFRLLTRPAEADEVHHGPPLTAADVDAFCTAMDDPAWPLLA